MSWQTPQAARKVDFPGPSGKSCGCWASAGTAAPSSAAVNVDHRILADIATSWEPPAAPLERTANYDFCSGAFCPRRPAGTIIVARELRAMSRPCQLAPNEVRKFLDEGGLIASWMQRMTAYFLNEKPKRNSWRTARFAVASVAAVIAASDNAGAASDRNERSAISVASRTAGEPMMAIISLRNQRITVHDSKGWILRAPVSSGQKGRETPAGIFSVIEKDPDHHSNLYDDAWMPHMQRITWSGIALHGGPLPGYPASHGCVRLPYDFAARLFDLTRLGMRVIVAPTDVKPIEIAHPALFMPKPGADAVAAARAAGAADATRKADQARLAATTAF